MTAGLFALLLVISGALNAQETKGEDAGTKRLFDTAATLDVNLRLPWNAIVTDEFFYSATSVFAFARWR